ncbi:MAG: CinA family nicotinamide mononucleotide deamidase-related protein [Candidatus Omnitrophica bacterium]|nr:CinA family nicotinamide mononucleotide deamidase-related protein [Candidatus Omnitrophota bacterium]
MDYSPNFVLAEIVTIGDELLKGSTLNTNAQFLAKELSDLGFCVAQQTACRDQIPAIEYHLKGALQRSKLVILTGGLGPTPDDVTRDAVAHYLKVSLKLSNSQYTQIKRHYRRYGHSIPSMVKREALYPESAVPLVNRHGIALGFYVPIHDRLLVVLPGVPAELRNMYLELVKPLIGKSFPLLRQRPALVVKMVGIHEPDVMTRLGRQFFRDPFDFGIYPQAGEVALRLYADKKSILAPLRRRIQLKLSRWVYAYADVSLSERVGQMLRKRGQTLATAESCTAGLLAAEIAKIPGASDYFLGSVIAYQDEIKQALLDVPAELLKRKGAVSKETTAAMAEGIRKRMKSTYGVGITGIAGPGGGSRRKAVGLVYIALASAKRRKVFEHQFWGGRLQVQTKAVKKALEYLWQEIRS